MVDNLQVGGAQKLLITFAHETKTRNINMSILSLEQPNDSPVAQELKKLDVNITFFPGRGLFDQKRIRNITRFLQHSNFDILHTHLTYSNILGAICGKQASIPVVATIHSASHEPGFRNLLKNQLETLALRYGVARVHAVGRLVGDANESRVSSNKLYVIPNAVPKPVPIPRATRTILRNEISGDNSRPILIYVGRMVNYKGCGDLISAFAIVHKKHPSAVLIMVGEGMSVHELKKQVDALMLNDHVIFLGLRDDVSRLLAASDIFVSGSHLEGLPLAVLEGMMSGLPIVATDVGDISKVIVPGTGLLVSPHQPEQLANAMSQLLSDPEKLKKYGASAREHALANISSATWMDQIERLYKEVLDLRSGVKA